MTRIMPCAARSLSCANITLHKQAEIELRQTNERLSTMVLEQSRAASISRDCSQK
jgi:hypothetical protein